VQIDHVLLPVADLDSASTRLRDKYGLSSQPGGAHPQWGTANRIVPLGGQYLELIAVADPELAAGNPFGQWVSRAAANGDVLAGLMVEPDDFDATCARLSLTPMPGQRTRSDGTSSVWRLAGVAEAISRTVPCFISWERRDDVFDGDAGVGASGIAKLELGGDADAISAWLGEPVDGLELVGGAPGIRSLTIKTGNGDVVLDEHP
jgi:hypothetical protein